MDHLGKLGELLLKLLKRLGRINFARLGLAERFCVVNSSSDSVLIDLLG